MTARSGDFHEAIAALQFDRFVGRVDLDAPWPGLRYALFKALEAAGSGTAINPNRPIQSERQRVMARRLQLHALVDAVRRHHDPYTDWWAFRATLYEAWWYLRSGTAMGSNDGQRANAETRAR